MMIDLTDNVTLHCGDCIEVMQSMDADSVDAVFCDPPYGLEFMGKEWDRLWVKRDKSQDLTGKSSSPFLAARVNKYVAGEQAQAWHQRWAEAALRVAKPGAMLLAFGGTRTHHRLTCAIEDAGWEIRDTMMWVYGSGFPKSHDISKAIDKAAGAEREVVGEYQFPPDHARPNKDMARWRQRLGEKAGNPLGFGTNGNRFITAPATDAAKVWDGYGTSLKPAWEPVVVAMKPLDGTFAANALKWGVAGLNVDGSRITTEEQQLDEASALRLAVLCASPNTDVFSLESALDVFACIVSALRTCSTGDTTLSHSGVALHGKWPAVVGCAGRLLDRLLPNVDVCGLDWSSRPDFQGDCPVCRRLCDERLPLVSAASQVSPPSLLDALSDMCRTIREASHSRVCECTARPSNSDVPLLVSSWLRLLCCSVKGYHDTSLSPRQAKRWPSNLVTDGSAEVVGLFPQTKPSHDSPRHNKVPIGQAGIYGIFKPVVTYGHTDTGSAARFFYTAKASRSERNAGMNGKQNGHPTVKPLALCRYLATLILPPKQDGRTRRLLVPFSGSGSEMIGALQAGWDHVVGIEKEQEYIEIAEKRIQYELDKYGLFQGV